MRRRPPASFCATVAIAAALLASVGTATARAASPAAWTTYDRPAQYAVAVDQHVSIQMSDGVLLNAVVRRPDAPGRYPVIVTITPYNRTNRAINVNNDYLGQP